MWYVYKYTYIWYHIFKYIEPLSRYPWHKISMKYQDVLQPRVCWQQNKHETETKTIGQNKAVPLRRRFRENQSSALRCNKFPERFWRPPNCKDPHFGMKISSGPSAFQNLCRFLKLEKIEPIMAGKLNEAGKPEAMDLQRTQKFQRLFPKRRSTTFKKMLQ